MADEKRDCGALELHEGIGSARVRRTKSSRWFKARAAIRMK